MPFPNDAMYRDCPWCGTLNIAMSVVGNTCTVTSSMGQAREWTWLSCPRCAGVLSVESHPNIPTVIGVVPDARKSSDVDHLPQNVGEYYANAIRVLDAGVPSSAAVELRRTLEAAAANFGVSEKALVKSVEKLAEQGLITPEFKKVLGHIRKVGNQGAHAGDVSLTEPEVRLAMKFTTQVLRNLFEVPAELALLGDVPNIDAASEAELGTV
jgi:hypothetical protein